MRVLCLHGYCQNARIFASKTAALRKSLMRDAGAELVYVDAPFVVDGTREAATAQTAPPPATASGPAEAPRPHGESELGNPKRTWWNASKDGAVYGGWQDTIYYLTNIFHEQGPFVGVLGFSQGAVLAHLICAIAAGRGRSIVQLPATDPAGAPAPDPPVQPAAARWMASEAAFATLRFAIIISGFPSRSRVHAGLMNPPAPADGKATSSGQTTALALPSLHVWGSADALVPPAASALLAQQFDEATRQALVHDGGHLVPGTADARKTMAHFVAQFRTEAASDGHVDAGASSADAAAREHATGAWRMGQQRKHAT